MGRTILALLLVLMPSSGLAYTLAKLQSHEQTEALEFRWPSKGEVTTITYSLVREPYRLRDGQRRAQCGEIVPITEQLMRSNITEEEFLGEAVRALESWSRVASVEFAYVHDPAAAQVLIGTQAVPTHGKAFVDLRLRPNGPRHQAEAAIVCFNPTIPLSVEHVDNCKDGLQIQYALRHEFGHVIGLDHGGNGQLMALRCTPDNDVMTMNEIAGALYIFGPWNTPSD